MRLPPEAEARIMRVMLDFVSKRELTELLVFASLVGHNTDTTFKNTYDYLAQLAEHKPAKAVLN